MDLEAQVREAILQELRRQGAAGGLRKVDADEDFIAVEGKLDLDALTMVVVASVAGGP